MDIQALHLTVAAAAPIDGVAIGDPADKATWRIDFKDEASAEQRAAARIVLDAFDANAEPVVEKARDLAAEFDVLKGVLAGKAVLTAQDVSAIDAAAVAIETKG